MLDYGKMNKNMPTHLHTESSTNINHRCLLGCLFLQPVVSSFRANRGLNQTTCPQKETLGPLCPESQNKAQSCHNEEAIQSVWFRTQTFNIWVKIVPAKRKIIPKCYLFLYKEIITPQFYLFTSTNHLICFIVFPLHVRRYNSSMMVSWSLMKFVSICFPYVLFPGCSDPEECYWMTAVTFISKKIKPSTHTDDTHNLTCKWACCTFCCMLNEIGI